MRLLAGMSVQMLYIFLMLRIHIHTDERAAFRFYIAYAISHDFETIFPYCQFCNTISMVMPMNFAFSHIFPHLLPRCLHSSCSPYCSCRISAPSSFYRIARGRKCVNFIFEMLKHFSSLLLLQPPLCAYFICVYAHTSHSLSLSLSLSCD